MNKIIAMPSDGPELSDKLSIHFGHCNYFIGVELNEQDNYKKVFTIRNDGHSGCMEPVLNIKQRNVTDLIVGGIGGRPYMGFLQFGINIYKGIESSLKENVEWLIRGKLEPLAGSSCGGGQGSNHHDNYM